MIEMNLTFGFVSKMEKLKQVRGLNYLNLKLKGFGNVLSLSMMVLNFNMI